MKFPFSISLVIILSIGVAASTNQYAFAQQKTAQKQPYKTGSPKKKGKSKTPATKSSTTNRGTSDLNKSKIAAEKEIKRSEKKLAENDRNIRKCVNDLQSIGADISKSQQRVDALNRNLAGLDAEMKVLETQIAQREEKIASLQKKYFEAIKKMRLKKGDNSTLAFIFSSTSMSQAMQRLRYLREFGSWRKKQSEILSSEISELNARREELEDVRRRHRRECGLEQDARQMLISQKQQKEQLVKKLRSDSDELKAYIDKRKNEVKQLNNQIAAAIEADRKRQAADEQRRNQAAEAKRKKEKEAKRETKITSKSEVVEGRKPRTEAAPVSTKVEESKKTSAPAKSTETTGFGLLKGKLPRPVAGAFKIIVPYGRNAKSGMENVTYDNTGIDVETSRNAPVKAIYEGLVAGIYKAPGFSHVVLVKHNDYYTVYANLGSVCVQQGEKVRQGQKLGSVGVDGDKNILHFEIWKERTRLNPSDWLGRQ